MTTEFERELINLVRQYGTERECVGGFTPDQGTLQAEKAQESLDAANALLIRISADLGNALQERDEARADLEQMTKNSEAWRAAAQPDPQVLRLPEVSKDATLIGEQLGYRWRWHEGSGGWCSAQRGPISLGRLLAIEGTVRVELVPPADQRSAAEIWRSMSEAERANVWDHDLHKALDREAGLS
jgi:hypothetical protein